MSIWRSLGAWAGSGVGAAFEWAGGLFGATDAETRRQVAFTVALVALAAKMAKADGVVMHSEVDALGALVRVPDDEAVNVRRLFDLAKRDVAGYDAYARRVAALYADEPAVLVDVLDGLFAIAKADGSVHEAELAFLTSVGAIFGISGVAFEQVAVRHVVPEGGDPYAILGVGRDWPREAIRRQYLKLVADHHPDRAIARGLPPDFLVIANDRMAAINRAWEAIERLRPSAVGTESA
jgi:DnaJ like chaperone protein